MLEALQRLNDDLPVGLRMRVGIHTGDVYCGILGGSKFSYDVWSDDVLIASKMESSGEPDRVHVSAATTQALSSSDFFELEPGDSFEYGNISQPLPTYFVNTTFEEGQSKHFLRHSSSGSIGREFEYITGDSGVDVPLMTMVLDLSFMAVEEAKKKLNLYLLYFRDPVTEKLFMTEKVANCLGNFLLMMSFVLACFVLETISETVLFAVDWSVYVNYIGIAFIVVLMFLGLGAYINTCKMPASAFGRFVYRIGERIRPFYEVHLIMFLTCSTVFACTVCNLSAPGDLPGYIASDVLLAALTVTVFYRLRHTVRSALSFIYITLFLILSMTVFDNNYNMSLDIVLPIAISLWLVIAYSNYSTEYVLRLNFLMKQSLVLLTDQFASIHDESEYLLAQILPPPIVDRLKESPGCTIADRYEKMGILFAGISNFADYRKAKVCSETEAIEALNHILCEFDLLCVQFGVYKIKTNGISSI